MMSIGDNPFGGTPKPKRRWLTWLGAVSALAVTTVSTFANAGTALADGDSGQFFQPVTDAGSSYSVTVQTGARNYWAAGFTGKGVDVALIDSGVVLVDGLSGAGKVVFGPDLSFESQSTSTRNVDTFGHGTHMAGLIAGRASGAVPGKYVEDTTHFLGMAPDARVLSIKTADANGRTDVSQVIAAIEWVIQHKNDNGMNIRVLNLAFATDSTQPYLLDPLVFAAEQAWKAGIFVVVSAGNDGEAPKKTGSLGNPARSPNLMTIGASDSNRTLPLRDDLVPDFSSSGTVDRRVDIVAPGSHIVSLRTPGSYIDRTYGQSGVVSATLFRGSGTSQAAAITSGAAALIIQQRPGITPGQLKALLRRTAQHLDRETMEAQGAGELDLTAALNTLTPQAKEFVAAPSIGTGTLDGARGSRRLTRNGVVLSGEQDIFGHRFDSWSRTGANSWSGGVWNGSTWTGSSWSASSWSASSWSASSWSASTWSASTWSASSWSASTWSASTWSSALWE